MQSHIEFVMLSFQGLTTQQKVISVASTFRYLSQDVEWLLNKSETVNEKFKAINETKPTIYIITPTYTRPVQVELP